MINKQKERKREEIRCKLEEDELERIRVSNNKYEESCKNKLKDIVTATLNKYKTLKIIEDTKFNQEIYKNKRAQKDIIKENIKNIYNNKIQILREKMSERKLYKLIFDIEHKAAFSDAERNRKAERK